MKYFKKGEDIIFNVVFFEGTSQADIKNGSDDFKKIILEKNQILGGLDFKNGTKVLANGGTMYYLVFVCPVSCFYFT